MGTDVYAYRGVVVKESQMAEIVNSQNCAQACRILLRHLAATLLTIKQHNEEQDLEEHERKELKQNASLLFRTFDQLSVSSAVGEVRKMLLSLTEGVADGASSHVENSELAIDIWSKLIEGLYPGTPLPQATEFIDAPRYQGWDLPKGEVLYVFPEDECFELVKTVGGKALDTMIGETTELSTWTTFSC